jgi:hypothetical protein
MQFAYGELIFKYTRNTQALFLPFNVLFFSMVNFYINNYEGWRGGGGGKRERKKAYDAKKKKAKKATGEKKPDGEKKGDDNPNMEVDKGTGGN